MTEENIDNSRIVYVYPVPVWVKDHGNYVMVNFQKITDTNYIQQVFQSPSGTSTLDMDLVNHLKTLNRGEAIMLPNEEGLTPRKLKVRVGKAATAANRKLEWAEVEGGFVARVIEILPEKPSANGVVQTTTPEATEEASTRGRRS